MALPNPSYYWNFNETSGTTALDSSAQIPMTITPGASAPNPFIAGKVGNGLRFSPYDGATNATTYVPEMTAPWSFGVWVLRERDAEGSAIFGGSTGIKLEQWGQQQRIGYTKFSFGGVVPGAFDAWSDAKTEVGKWTHIAFVASSDKLLVYLDGVPSEIKKNGSESISNAVLSLRNIGSNGTGSEVSSVIMDEMKVFKDLALSPDQVQELFKSILPQILVTESGNNQGNNASINLGSANVGAQGLSKTFTVSNVGTADLNITGISIDNSTHYTLAPAATSKTLKKGDQVSFTVTFNPKNTSPGNATVSIASNDPNLASMKLNFTGSAISVAKPRLEVAVGGAPLANGGALDFGNAVVNGTPVARQIVITNRGDANLQIESVQLAGAMPPFSLAQPVAAQSLAPGQSVTVTVNYNNASGTGMHAASLTIRSSDTNLSTFTLAMNAGSVGRARLTIKQHPTMKEVKCGDVVNWVSFPGCEGVYLSVWVEGDKPVTLNFFRASVNGLKIFNCGGGGMAGTTDTSQGSTYNIPRDMSGSPNGLSLYPNTPFHCNTFGVAANPGVYQRIMNGARISVTVNDPDRPEFWFTIAGVPDLPPRNPSTMGTTNVPSAMNQNLSGWRFVFNTPAGSGTRVDFPNRGKQALPLNSPSNLEIHPPWSNWNGLNPAAVQVEVSGNVKIISRSGPNGPNGPIIISLQPTNRMGSPLTIRNGNEMILIGLVTGV